jgi:hypothetical protein
MGKLTNLNRITEAEIPGAIARDTEVTAASNAHLAATDPHLQYATQARTDERYGLVKNLVYTSTTASTQGTSILIPHGGLLVAKILSLNGIVEHSPGLIVPPGHTTSAGYEYELSANATYIFVSNLANKSINILSKPVRIVINYSL